MFCLVSEGAWHLLFLCETISQLVPLVPFLVYLELCCLNCSQIGAYTRIRYIVPLILSHHMLSPAVFQEMDCYLTWFFSNHQLATLLTLILIILINLAVGILPHVDNFAHLGGFVAGYLLGFILLIRPQFGYVSQKNAPPGYFLNSKKHKYKLYQYILLITSLILLIVG